MVPQASPTERPRPHGPSAPGGEAPPARAPSEASLRRAAPLPPTSHVREQARPLLLACGEKKLGGQGGRPGLDLWVGGLGRLTGGQRGRAPKGQGGGPRS